MVNDYVIHISLKWLVNAVEILELCNLTLAGMKASLNLQTYVYFAYLS